MKVLITGATGFMGLQLVKRLHQKHDVEVLVRRSYNQARLEGVDVIRHVWDDTPRHMIEILGGSKPDLVMHLATSFFGSEHKPENLDSMIRANVRLPSFLLDAMVRTGCGNFINTGSIAQHTNNETYAPLNYFAATKQCCADILTYFINVGGLKRAVTLELSDTYGPDDPRSKLIQLLQRVAKSGESLGMSPGEQYLDYVHVEDVVSAYEHAIDVLQALPEGTQKTYAVRSGNHIMVKDFVALFNKLNPAPAKVVFGARDYHGPEFLVPWQQGEVLPGWHPTLDFETELSKILQSN
jgi:nucleoside-diphosphate-sugar epimerase